MLGTIVISLLVVFSIATQPSTTPPAALDPSTWSLGLRLYQKLRLDSGSVNTLFSPLLVASSLGAVSEGAAGTTVSQLQQLLEKPKDKTTNAHLSQSLTGFVEANQTGFMLHFSSALFSKKATLRPSLMSHNEEMLKIKHRPLLEDWSPHKQIDDWAKAELFGGFQGGSPVEPEVHLKAGAMIVANALRFKGLWERDFSDRRNDERTFLGRKYTKVMMMHRAGLYCHFEDMENMVQVLEVPLWGGEASVVLLLPFHVENLSRLEKLLTVDLLSNWLQKTNTTSVAISLPRTNISCTLGLQKQLSALGLIDAWDQEVADFSRVADQSEERLHLGGVLHWASLELAPEGGEGSADLEDEHVERPKLFYADHPFLFFVRDLKTGALLLMGALDLAEGEALHDEL
ncbi:serine (or cysteine) peptidase inhibitor, clade H, member 2 [Synchiropus splendidus]|uniref:serine (or cysteine) peptidase inhibitor, clade H, member 2 n=1 Tax=Synchiropus splendidus TaxID=270530 RepID=UPI00237EDFB3|nr:serine (or cysteine) peptidase inhibitor, clade H, member 2 [Synchiropus splendidus]